VIGISLGNIETLGYVFGSDDGVWLEALLAEVLGDTLGRTLWNEMLGTALLSRRLGPSIGDTPFSQKDANKQNAQVKVQVSCAHLLYCCKRHSPNDFVSSNLLISVMRVNIPIVAGTHPVKLLLPGVTIARTGQERTKIVRFPSDSQLLMKEAKARVDTTKVAKLTKL
jgi:hypothetical protein